MGLYRTGVLNLFKHVAQLKKQTEDPWPTQRRI